MKKLIYTLALLLHAHLLFAQAGDCPGLCVTAGGSYTAVAGSTQELSATNRGCLVANEATSSFWFQVCFTSAGTFTFTVDPAGGNNDFDFAVWNGSNCAPTGAPIRCSYAATSPPNDQTGLGNGAVDNSENAFGDGWVSGINVTAGQCLTININNYGNGSNNFTISFGGPALTCPTLPIELLDFNAEMTTKGARVQWTTASEVNNSHFTIWKSIDGEQWGEIAKVDGAGNSSAQLSYEKYVEVGPGTSYLRLSQTDYDGVTKYFRAVSVNNTIVAPTLIKRIDFTGREVDENYKGICIEIYSNGERKKVAR